MKKLYFLILLSVSLSLPVEFINVRKLKSGMYLDGKTRMSGNEMVEFKLKVLSVLKGARPGEDSLMAEITNKLFHETGVLAGMSGSPVYYQDKLVGAVAYTYSFSKKPIVGITPIHSMMRLVSYSQLDKKERYMEGRKFYGLSSIATPLAVSGNLAVPEEALKQILGNKNYVVVPGSVGTASEANDAFQPGDACGVNLVNGDMQLTAFGTVTYVSNDFVLAFGHPFNSLGRVELPLFTAQIDAVVPLMTLSYKIGSLGKEVGSIVEDRAPAVLGKMGQKSGRIPLSVKIKTDRNTLNFKYNIVELPQLFNSLCSLLIANSFIHYESVGEESTLLYKMTIHTDYKKKDITIVDTYSTGNNLDALMQLLQMHSSILSYIDNNPFLPIAIKGVDLEIDVKNEITYYGIEDILVNKVEYYPGETVKLKVDFMTYKKGEVSKEFEFVLPKNIKPGKYPLFVSSGYFFMFSDAFNNPGRYRPNHPDKIFKILNNEINSKTLSIFLYADAEGLVIKGKEYRRLPVFQRHLLMRSMTVKKESLYDFNTKHVKFEHPVLGAASVDIVVKINKQEGQTQ